MFKFLWIIIENSSICRVPHYFIGIQYIYLYITYKNIYSYTDSVLKRFGWLSRYSSKESRYFKMSFDLFGGIFMRPSISGIFTNNRSKCIGPYIEDGITPKLHFWELFSCLECWDASLDPLNTIAGTSFHWCIDLINWVA